MLQESPLFQILHQERQTDMVAWYRPLEVKTGPRSIWPHRNLAPRTLQLLKHEKSFKFHPTRSSSDSKQSLHPFQNINKKPETLRGVCKQNAMSKKLASLTGRGHRSYGNSAGRKSPAWLLEGSKGESRRKLVDRPYSLTYVTPDAVCMSLGTVTREQY